MDPEQVFGHEVQGADFGLGNIKVALTLDPNGLDPLVALLIAPGEGVHGDLALPHVGVALLAGAAVGHATTPGHHLAFQVLAQHRLQH